MKRLHRMIIGAFAGPLLVTFVIVLFILTAQVLGVVDERTDERTVRAGPLDVLEAVGKEPFTLPPEEAFAQARQLLCAQHAREIAARLLASGALEVD